MSGEGKARPPFAVARLGGDGNWHVVLMVPLKAPVWEADHETLLDADEAERLARQLIDHAALIRDKLGLPGGQVYP